MFLIPGNENDTMPLARGFNEALSFNLGIRYLGPFDPQAENCAFPDAFDKFVWANCPHAVQVSKKWKMIRNNKIAWHYTVAFDVWCY